MNAVQLIGRLTKAVESKRFEDSKVVAKFSIAINRGKDKEDVDYFDCEAWGKTAEVLINYAGKGSRVGIVGRLKQDRWTSPEGQTRNAVRVIAERIELLGGNTDDRTEESTEGQDNGQGTGQSYQTGAKERSTPQKQAVSVGASQGEEVDFNDIPF